MVPEKLTDATMEFILWNKVPIALQQELKEIPDGSVQELLQRLLHAEATLKERERRSKESRQEPSQRHTTTANRSPHSGHGRDSNTGRTERNVSNTNSANANPQQQGEMLMKAVKCFNCHKRGHVAKDCPVPRGQRPQSTRRIAAESGGPTEEPARPVVKHSHCQSRIATRGYNC